jgi:hypothetical protein
LLHEHSEADSLNGPIDEPTFSHFSTHIGHFASPAVQS